MKFEQSAGAVVFLKEKESIKYLILQYAAHHWDFPKGHIEKGEEELETVKRETQEETGITDLSIVPDFKEKIAYFFSADKEKIKKEVVFYLAQTRTKAVKLSFEHEDFLWLPYDEACDKVTFKTAKDILKKANDFLESKK